MEDLTGKQFGHYQIVAPLGEGGMAAVYKAYQPSMERYVALKVLPRHMSQSEEFVIRFGREAKLLAQLQHPHILPVFDYGEADGYPYIVMPFIPSGTLAAISQERKLSLAEVRRIMMQVGKALSFAHARGMIHRDIKPSNILIDEDGNCLLTDFGLARMLESSIKITSSDTVMGTPAYMSPEQGTGNNTDQRSDIYSLGVVFYELVTGRVPYVAETPVAVVFKHIQDPLPSARKLNPSLPESVELILLKALAKDANDRYQTADEFVRAIQAALPETDREPASILTSVQDKAEVYSNTTGTSQQTRSVPVPAPSQNVTRTVRSGGFALWAVAGFAAISLFVVLGIGGFLLFNAKIKSAPTAMTVATQEIAPTNVPIIPPTAAAEPTSTVEAVTVPTTNVTVADDILSQYLSQYSIVSADTFDDPSGTGWDIQSGRIEDGQMVIVGNSDWNGVWRNHEFSAGEGLLIDFSFAKDSSFTIHLNNGFNNDTPPYRRFGLVFEHDFPIPDVYVGQYTFEPFTKESGFEAGKTYTLLIARVSETKFLEAAWDASNQSIVAEFTKDFGDMPENSHWTFLVQCSQGTLQFDNYAELQFSGEKK